MKTARHATSILIVLLWLLFSAATPGSSPCASISAHAQGIAAALASTAIYAAPSTSASIVSPIGQSPCAPQDDKVKRKGKPVMRAWDTLRALPVSLPPLPRAVANLGVADSRTGIFVPGIYPSTRGLRAPPLS